MVEEHCGEVKSGDAEGHKKRILFTLCSILLMFSHLSVDITETPVRVLNGHMTGT